MLWDKIFEGITQGKLKYLYGKSKQKKYSCTVTSLYKNLEKYLDSHDERTTASQENIGF